MEYVTIGGRQVSRFILGSNPFSGFSHQGRERDSDMVHYWTCDRIKALLREAESLGVNTIIARMDFHIVRVLMEHWDEGGALQWFGQTCPELGAPEPSLRRLANYGGPACHIHGGYADHLTANGRLEELKPTVDYAKSLGIAIGLAGHNTETIRWAEENLDLDYYMCCYYHPISRKQDPEHRPGTDERYREVDREAMTDLIQTLSRPVIHYKVLAAGRNDPAEAFAFAAGKVRPGDACCVGIYAGDDEGMLAEDVRLLGDALAARSTPQPAS